MLLAGCPQRPYKIWVADGSTADALVFGMATTLHGETVRPLSLLMVSTCSAVDARGAWQRDRPVWRIEAWYLPDSLRLLHAVEYGHPPPGFAGGVAPQRLNPGCYVATASAGGSGEVQFWVQADGSLRNWSKGDDDSASIAYRHYSAESDANADSALAKCVAAYRRAGTAADTVSVDGAMWGDTARFGAFSCRDYRRVHWSLFQKRPWAEDSTGKGG